MQTLHYSQKKIDQFFVHENIEKLPSKVAHNRPQTFFSQSSPSAKTSPELIFHIIKCREQASVLSNLWGKLQLAAEQCTFKLAAQGLCHPQ